MKKLIILTLAAIVPISCSDVHFWRQPGNIRVIAHTQTIENLSLVWEAADSLCVFDKQGNPVNMAIEAAGKSNGVFYTCDWTEDAPLLATFPCHPDVECMPSDSLVSACLLSGQSAYDMETCPAFAAVGAPSGGNNLYKMVPMYNIMGMIKVQVTKPDVSKIVVTSNGGLSMAGTVMVDYKRLVKGETGFWTPVEGKTVESVVVTPVAGSDASDENGCFAMGFYYISVLPGLYEQGLNIKMLDSSESAVDELNIPGDVSVPLNAVFDVDDLMPDDVEFVFDFTAGTNPMGTFPKRAEQLTSGNDYTYTYDYQFNGGDMSKDFIFTLYKGAEGYLYEPKDEVNVLHIVKPNSTDNASQCCLKLPAVPYRYLKSVSIVHRGVTAERQYRLQEGYPTPGHYYTLRLADNTAADTDPADNVAAGTLNIPTGATETAMIQTTKRNTPYYVQFRSNADYYIDKIVVKYSRTLE